MYCRHFGFREAPFGITPDTSFYFGCKTYQEALNTLLVAVHAGEGFIKITGEVGHGKTLLCRKFMASLNDQFFTAYIPNPQLDPRALMLAVADELEIAPEQHMEQHRLLRAIYMRLLQLGSCGKRVVLCIDEAQAMSIETLEALRLLTNLETEKRKLLQIVMFGQPELDRKLQQEEIRQLNQRITFHYRLAPLSREDLDFYLAHRLSVAGFTGGRLFNKRAVRALHEASKGTPRLVNILAHKALMLTYGEGRREVSTRHVRAAAIDTSAASLSSSNWMWASATLAGLVMFAVGWIYFQ